jgi:hypothetical protein
MNPIFLGWHSAPPCPVPKAGVGIQTIKRFEALDDVPPSRSSTLLDVQATSESAGIEFIGSPTDRRGIRLAARPRKPKNARQVTLVGQRGAIRRVRIDRLHMAWHCTFHWPF